MSSTLRNLNPSLDNNNSTNSDLIIPIKNINQVKNKSQLFNLNILFYLILWYSVSSLTAQLTKSILNNFDFPIFVGEFQFFFNFFLGYLTIILLNKKPFKKFKNWLPSSTLPISNSFNLNKIYFKLFFPMGTFQFIGKLFSLAATSICPIATVSSIRALGPLFIILGYRLYYKVLFSLKIYLSLLPLLLGVIIIVISQSNYSNNSNNSNQISIYNEQLNSNLNNNLVDNSFVNIDTKNLNNINNINNINNNINNDINSDENSFINLFFNLISNNKIQLHGIFYALLSTSVFAAGSIYTKNVITNNNINLNSNNLNLKSKNELIKLALLDINDNSSLSDLDLEKNNINKAQDLEYLENNSDNINIENNTTTTITTNNNDILKSNIKIDKLTTLMYCSLYGLAYSIPAFLIYELPIILFSSKFLPSNLNDTPAVQTNSIPYYSLIPWSLLILNGCSYFLQSLLAFHILGLLPTVTYSIANMMKRIIVITISIFLRGGNLSLLEWLGLFHVSIGLYIYEKWGAKKSNN